MTGPGIGLTDPDPFAGAANRFDSTSDYGFSNNSASEPIDVGGGTTAAPLDPQPADLSMYTGEQDAGAVGTAARSLAAGGLMGAGFRDGALLNRAATATQGRLGEWSRSADDLARRQLDDAFRPLSEVDARKAAERAGRDAGKTAGKAARATSSRGLNAARTAATGARNMVGAGTNALARTSAARALTPVATRLGGRALAMAAAAAVPGPGWAIAIGIGLTIGLELVFNDKFRTWMGNVIRGGGIDINEPPSPPETNFLPMARDDRDTPIKSVDSRITASNASFVDIDPKEHKLWDIQNPGIDRLKPMMEIADHINTTSQGLNDAVSEVGRIYSGATNTDWIGDQAEALAPELRMMGQFGESVGQPIVDAALHSSKASNEVFQAIREANAKSRDAIARSQGKWLSTVPMSSGVGKATVDENLMTDNNAMIEDKLRESTNYAKKVEDAAKEWGVLRPKMSEAALDGVGPHDGGFPEGAFKGKETTDPEKPNDPPADPGSPWRPLPGVPQSPIRPNGPGTGGSPWPGPNGGGDAADDPTDEVAGDPFAPVGEGTGTGTDPGSDLGEYGTGTGAGDGFGDPTTGFGTGGDGGAFGGDTGSPFDDPLDSDPAGGLGIDPTTSTSGFNPFGDESFDDILGEEGDTEDPFAEDGPGPLGADVEAAGPDSSILDEGGIGEDGGDSGFGPVVGDEEDPLAGDEGEFDPFGTEGGETGVIDGESIEGGTAPPGEEGAADGGFGSEAGGGGGGSTGGGGEGAFGSEAGGSTDPESGSALGSEAGSDAGEGAFGSEGDPGSAFQGTDLSEDPAGSPWGATPGSEAEMDPERTVDINGEPVQFVSPETAGMVEAVQNPETATEGMAFRELAEQNGLELPPEGQDIGMPISPAEMQPGDVLSSEGKQYMFVGGEDAMDMTTGEMHPLSEVANFSGEHEGIFRLPGAEGENLIPNIGGSVGDTSDGGAVAADQMSNTTSEGADGSSGSGGNGGGFERTDEAPVGMGAGQNAPGGASESGMAASGDTSAAGTSSFGDNAAPGDPATTPHAGGGEEGGIAEVPYEGREFGGEVDEEGTETLGPEEGEIDSTSIGGESSATSSMDSGSSAPQGLDPSRVTGGS